MKQALGDVRIQMHGDECWIAPNAAVIGKVAKQVEEKHLEMPRSIPGIYVGHWNRYRDELRADAR